MLTVDEIEYWEEQKALASKNHADRTATMNRVAEAGRRRAPLVSALLMSRSLRPITRGVFRVSTYTAHRRPIAGIEG
jgi:hypothetical protein